jgi:hypothetical protein
MTLAEEYKQGTIVKLVHDDSYVYGWTNFVSEIICPPQGHGTENFTLRYGNEVRDEYSEMNFWRYSMLSHASADEKYTYSIVGTVMDRGISKGVSVWPFKSKINVNGVSRHHESVLAKDGEVEVIICSDYFNAYSDGVYALGKIKGDRNELKYKIWDSESKSFCEFSCNKNKYYVLI